MEVSSKSILSSNWSDNVHRICNKVNIRNKDSSDQVMDISRKCFVSDYNQQIGTWSEDLVSDIDLAAERPRHHLHRLQHPHVLHPLSQRVLQTSGGYRL